jgi:hypothetical protein
VDSKPCLFRRADDQGRILCNRIKTGDGQVTPNTCLACPIVAIDCRHLRATLEHRVSSAITVRYGNGKTQIWQDPTPGLTLERAACEERLVSISSPCDCAGCRHRQSLITPDSDAPAPSARRLPKSGRPRGSSSVRCAATGTTDTASSEALALETLPSHSNAPGAPILEAQDRHAGGESRKIIRIDEWLERRANARLQAAQSEGQSIPAAASIPSAPITRQRQRQRAG